MIKVDKDKCIGCGLCVSICGEIFEMGEDGKAKVRIQRNLSCVNEAMEQCPVGAISK